MGRRLRLMKRNVKQAARRLAHRAQLDSDSGPRAEDGSRCGLWATFRAMAPVTKCAPAQRSVVQREGIAEGRASEKALVRHRYQVRFNPSLAGVCRGDDILGVMGFHRPFRAVTGDHRIDSFPEG